MDKKTLKAVISLINKETNETLKEMSIANNAESMNDYSYITDEDDDCDYENDELKEINNMHFYRNEGKTSALLNLRDILYKEIEAIDKKAKKARGK
jgi:hypothetical protein